MPSRNTEAMRALSRFGELAWFKLPTQVEWMLDRTRRNWILLPGRLRNEAQGLEDPAFSDVVHSINTQDQEFYLKAFSDLDLIVRHLQQIPIPEI
ncbi:MULTISPECIES: hypothetical protein [unclassified Streptomyces]|uniref:hypothetical protein n=1 Tax=unclassified Streptomyces TaxID=2593676 RepID=UPI00131CE693|nr:MULTISPECIES: hypothetical protein [unclassified Streptomyces]